MSDYFKLDYSFWSNKKGERFLEISILKDDGDGRGFVQESARIPLKELFNELLEEYKDRLDIIWPKK